MVPRLGWVVVVPRRLAGGYEAALTVTHKASCFISLNEEQNVCCSTTISRCVVWWNLFLEGKRGESIPELAFFKKCNAVLAIYFGKYRTLHSGSWSRHLVCTTWTSSWFDLWLMILDLQLRCYDSKLAPSGSWHYLSTLSPEDLCIPIIAPSTFPKFNSSPLKSYRNPIGKDRLPTIIFHLY